MRWWEVLVWGAAIFDKHDEKMRSSRLGCFKLQIIWWEYEKFSLSLLSRFDLMRSWEILVWGLPFLIDMMRRWDFLVWGFQASIYLMRIWEVLIISPFKIRLDEKMRSSRLGATIFDRHDEKMRNSCLGGFKLQLTWWEYEKFSSSLPFKIRLDEKIRSSRFGGSIFW